MLPRARPQCGALGALGTLRLVGGLQVLLSLQAARGWLRVMTVLMGPEERPNLFRLQGRGRREVGWKFLSPQQGCEGGSSSLFTKNWHAGVTGPPWSTSEVSLGQIKGSVLHPAGEDTTDGTHYSKMWSRLEI